MVDEPSFFFKDKTLADQSYRLDREMETEGGKILLKQKGSASLIRVKTAIHKNRQGVWLDARIKKAEHIPGQYE